MRRTLNPTTGAEGEQGQRLDAPVLDAIAAYDQVAPGYRELSARRRAYLDAVDAEILQRVPQDAQSLIDVGAGDGRRALQIAASAKIPQVVLVEPSAGMRGLIPSGVEVWCDQAEALTNAREKFDVALCLWNVLGHVPTHGLRVAALENLSRLCSGSGLIFLDVLNRHNVAECGAAVVLRRVLFSFESGDVPVSWQTSAGNVETRGHVFSAGEMEQLFREARLKVVERIILHYRTGRQVAWSLSGNFFYVLRAH